jgi:hypothetical protein
MLDGGTFSDVAFSLVRSHGLEPEEAVVVSERAFRGGDGVSAGLGRERVYIESFVRVGKHLAAHPGDEDVLAVGQIAVDAASALRRWCRQDDVAGTEERRARSSSAM